MQIYYKNQTPFAPPSDSLLPTPQSFRTLKSSHGCSNTTSWSVLVKCLPITSHAYPILYLQSDGIHPGGKKKKKEEKHQNKTPFYSKHQNTTLKHI